MLGEGDHGELELGATPPTYDPLLLGIHGETLPLEVAETCRVKNLGSTPGITAAITTGIATL